MLTGQSRLNFGKHKGKLLQWVIEHDPEYVLWCQENIDRFEIDQDAEDALEWAMADIWDDQEIMPLDDEQAIW